jgi:predicted RNase H-like HicB family nuclease
MPTKFRDLEKLLKAEGYRFDHATGSHSTYVHPTEAKLVVPFSWWQYGDCAGYTEVDPEAGGAQIMASYTATVERAGDGSWTAALFSEDAIVLGAGATKEEALESLRQGILGALAPGETLPESAIELVNIEVGV